LQQRLQQHKTTTANDCNNCNNGKSLQQPMTATANDHNSQGTATMTATAATTASQ